MSVPASSACTFGFLLWKRFLESAAQSAYVRFSPKIKEIPLYVKAYGYAYVKGHSREDEDIQASPVFSDLRLKRALSFHTHTERERPFHFSTLLLLLP